MLLNKSRFRAVSIGVACLALVTVHQLPGMADDPTTCDVVQVDSDPSGYEFTNVGELQDQLNNAASDTCDQVVVQFSAGLALQGSTIDWEGPQPLELVGQSVAATTLDASAGSDGANSWPAVRAVYVGSDPAPALTIADLTITGGLGGDRGGAAVLTRGQLSIDGAMIDHNTASGPGGAINVGGNLTVNNSVISNNSSGSNGGAIYTDGNATVDNSEISDNSVHGTVGSVGGAVSFNGGTFNIANSVISGNSVTDSNGASGGAIDGGTGTLNVVRSRLESNSASAVDDFASGGAAVAANVRFTDSELIGNSGIGGISVQGFAASAGETMTLVGTTVSGNQGISATGSVSGALGPGSNATFSATNSTITANEATAATNATATAGIYADNGAALTFSTVVNNVVSSGTVHGRDLHVNNGLTAKGLVVANSAEQACDVDRQQLEPTSGYNATLQGQTAACRFSPDQGYTTEQLGLSELADNGGPTQTMAVSPSSVLNDKVPNAVGMQILGADATDQRGVMRSNGATVPNGFTIGAEQNATVSFDANGGSGVMSPQTAVKQANLTANGFEFAGHIFTGWKTQDGTAYPPGGLYDFAAAAPKNANATLFAQWIDATPVVQPQQLAPPGCVPTSIPSGRSKVTLTFRGCGTTANQEIGTKTATLAGHGDVRLNRLVCKAGAKKLKPKRLATYGRGYVHCANGRLMLVAGSRPTKVKITWYAPAAAGYSAFVRTKTIRMA